MTTTEIPTFPAGAQPMLPASAVRTVAWKIMLDGHVSCRDNAIAIPSRALTPFSAETNANLRQALLDMLDLGLIQPAYADEETPAHAWLPVLPTRAGLITAVLWERGGRA